MQLKSIFTIAIASTALVSACDKKSESDKETAKVEVDPKAEAKVAPKAEAKPTPIAEVAKVEPVVELPPETPEQIKAQCASLLVASWKAIQPAIAILEIPDAASLEMRYTGGSMDAKKFLELCESLPQLDRKCLTDSKNPIAAPLTCEIDSKKTGGKTFRIPSMPGKSPLLKTLPIGKASVSKLAGTWLNKSSSRTWTISKKGKTKQVQKKPDGSIKPATSLDEFTISFTKEKSAKRQYPGSNSQTLSLFMTDKKTFYSSGNLNFGAYDFKDGKTFVAKMNSDWLLSDNETCQAVTFQGQIVPATCEKKEREGATYMDIAYQVPGKVHWKTKAPEPTTVSFLIQENHLIARGLLDVGKFEKQ